MFVCLLIHCNPFNHLWSGNVFQSGVCRRVAVLEAISFASAPPAVNVKMTVPRCADATPVELLSCLDEATVPQSGMNFEDRLPRESVQGTLEEDASRRTQKTVLWRKGRTGVNALLSCLHFKKDQGVSTRSSSKHLSFPVLPV